jgi:uncharacterized protein
MPEHDDAMRKFPVPGKVLKEWVIPARGYAAFELSAGQVLRLIDLEGKQVADLVCFDARHHGDCLNLGNSVVLNKRIDFRKGDVLYSVLCKAMMTIVGYSNELSYAYGPMCSEELNQIRFGVPHTPNCRGNLAMALGPRGFNYRDVPNAFAPFMNVQVDENGVMEIKEPTSVAGDYYDLRADMDLLVGLSNCPQERAPTNGFNPTALGVMIYN